MKQYSVRILRRAEEDLQKISRYLAGETPQRSLWMVDHLLDKIESLAQAPERGARPRDQRLRKKGYRFLVSDPYLIFYKVHPARVYIHRIVHGKRAYERIL